MKTTIIAVVIVVMMGLAVTYKNSDPISYVKSTSEVVQVEVTPEWAKDEEAVKAAQDVIKRKELEAQLKEKDAQILEAEASLKALKEERKGLATELSQY